MVNSLMIVCFIAFAAAAELSEELNSYMQLVPFPDDYREKLLMIMVFDFGGSWVVEYICWWFFSNNKPKKSLGLQ